MNTPLSTLATSLTHTAQEVTTPPCFLSRPPTESRWQLGPKDGAKSRLSLTSRNAFSLHSAAKDSRGRGLEARPPLPHCRQQVVTWPTHFLGGPSAVSFSLITGLALIPKPLFPCAMWSPLTLQFTFPAAPPKADSYSLQPEGRLATCSSSICFDLVSPLSVRGHILRAGHGPGGRTLPPDRCWVANKPPTSRDARTLKCCSRPPEGPSSPSPSGFHLTGAAGQVVLICR